MKHTSNHTSVKHEQHLHWPECFRLTYTGACKQACAKHCHLGSGDQGSLEVHTQPLHLMYRPVCLSRISELMSFPSHETQASRLTEATNALLDANAHSLAVAQRALKNSLLPIISVLVSAQALLPGLR